MASVLTVSLVLFHLLVFSCPLPVLSGLCNKDDKKALLAIKRSFDVPDPFPTWNNAFACCDWYGVDCDANGRVYGISILADNISGPVPPAIADLPTIQVIRLHKLPNLHSPIPSTFTNLKRLRFLTISWAGLTGPVPAFLSQIPALEQLDLSFNQLSGSIPPSLGVLPALYAIDISRNQLSGSIPETLFQSNKQTPSYLTLSHNNLTGPIPQALSNINISRIDVSRNKLTGDASFLFGRSKIADTIDLSRNQLNFDLSSVEFPEGLDILSLEHNMIYGSIPAQITQLKYLQFLNVSYNRLCGEIPVGGRLGGFDQYCFFHNKCLCGAPLAPCK